MTIAIRYQMTGEAEAISRLNKLDAAGRDLGLAMFSISQRMQEYEKRQFATEGAYGSGGWAPLSEAYAGWKEKHYPGMPILQRTEALMKSLTEDTAEGAVRDIGPHSLVFGTDIDYAKYHQAGTEKMPARPPLVLKLGVRGFFTRIIKDTIMAQITWEKAVASGTVGINEDLSTP